MRLSLAQSRIAAARGSQRRERLSHVSAVPRYPVVPGAKGSVSNSGAIGSAGSDCARTISAHAQAPRKVTIDDLMALRTINDVKISPAGDLVAYTVSTPSVARNAHEAALFVIPVARRTPEPARRDATASSRPRCRRRACDGGPTGSISVLVAEKTGPQVLSDQAGQHRRADRDVGAARRQRLRVVAGRKIPRLPLARCRPASTPPIANKVGANPPATRSVAAAAQSRRPGARDHRRPINTSTASRGRPTARRSRMRGRRWSDSSRRIRRRSSRSPSSGGAVRPIIDRPGMNVSPQFSPDGKQDLVHLDQRAHRHHRAARPRDRRRIRAGTRTCARIR